MNINATGLDHGAGRGRIGRMRDQNINTATDRAAGFNHPAQVSALRRLEHDPAPLQTDRARLDQTAVFERAGKDADRIALQSTQIDSGIDWCLHLQADAFQTATREFNLAPGRQKGAAVGRLDQRVLAGIQLRAQQHHIAAAGQDAALHRNARATRCAVTKTHAPSQGIGVAHAQRRCGEAGAVDHGAGTDRDARLVDQHQIAVAAQGAENLRRVIRHHAVDGGATDVGLLKIGGAAGRNGKALPVDRRVVAQGAVLCRHRQLVALVQHAGLTDDSAATAGVGQCIGGSSKPGAGNSDGQRTQTDHTRVPAITALPARARAATAGAGNFGHCHHGAQSLIPDRAIDVIQGCATRHKQLPKTMGASKALPATWILGCHGDRFVASA